MKIQVIGLPGSGKTTYIQKFLDECPDVQHLDIRSFTGINRERRFKQAIQKTQGPVIAESACGVPRVGHIVRINTDLQTIFKQLELRDGKVDPDYLSLLGTQMVSAHATLNSPEDLPGYLTTILRR